MNKAAEIVSHDLKDLRPRQSRPRNSTRARPFKPGQIPLDEADVSEIARGLYSLRDMDLPLDEPAIAKADRYVSLTADDAVSGGLLLTGVSW